MEWSNRRETYVDMEEGKEKVTWRSQKTISEYEASFQATIDIWEGGGPIVISMGIEED